MIALADAKTLQGFLKDKVANVGFDADIWRDLRSPAAVGLHPIGPAEIWDYFAAGNVQGVRRDDSPDYLAVPEAFAEAKERFRRAVIVSMLLPVAPCVICSAPRFR